MFGIDYAWSHPSVAAMQGAKVKFVCRYLSHDVAKDISKAEAIRLTNADIWTVVVWETTANRALSGRAGGVADAKTARDKAKLCGMPDDRPIYFAVDWDARSQNQLNQIATYLGGAASVIGKDRVGVYAGYVPVKWLLDNGYVAWAWQTYAWSGGKWDSRAHIQQYHNGVNLGGADVDYDRSTKDDFGQWKIGESPDMALSTADKDFIKDAVAAAVKKVPEMVWGADGIVPASDDNPENKFWAPKFTLSDVNRKSRATLAAVTALAQNAGAQVDEEELARVIVAGLDPATLAEMLKQQSIDIATQVMEQLKARLET